MVHVLPDRGDDIVHYQLALSTGLIEPAHLMIAERAAHLTVWITEREEDMMNAEPIDMRGYTAAVRTLADLLTLLLDLKRP